MQLQGRGRGRGSRPLGAAVHDSRRRLSNSKIGRLSAVHLKRWSHQHEVDARDLELGEVSLDGAQSVVCVEADAKRAQMQRVESGTDLCAESAGSGPRAETHSALCRAFLGRDEDAAPRRTHAGDGGTELSLFAAGHLLPVVKGSVYASAAGRPPSRKGVRDLGPAASPETDARHEHAVSNRHRR